MKKRLITALQVSFFIGLGLFLIWYQLNGMSAQDKQDMAESMKKANYLWLVLSIFLGVLSHLSRAMRWNLVMRPAGYNPSLINSFFSVMVGYFTNLAVPRAGEIARCATLARYEKVPVHYSVGTVVMERAIDLIMLFLVFVLAFAVEFDVISKFMQVKVLPAFNEKLTGLLANRNSLLMLAAVGIALITLFALLRKKLSKFSFYEKIKGFVLGLWEGVLAIRNVESKGWYLFHSAFIWLMYYMMLYVCYFSIPETAHLSMGSALAVLGAGSIAMIIVQGGLGAYPLFVAWTLLLYGVDETFGKSFGWLVWSAQTIMIILFGLVSLILLPVVNRNATKPAAENGSPETNTI